MARRSLGDERPQAALVLTTAPADVRRVVEAVRGPLGEVPLVGGAVDGILSDRGFVDLGAAVACFVGDTLSPSFAGGGHATGLVAAADRTARLILSGAPHRRHYPRGLALIFASPNAQGQPTDFIAQWREIAGPKLRTVFSQISGGALYGPGSEDPGSVAVLCLEGSYQTGIGVAHGFGPGESVPDTATLAQGAADAAMTAVKRLEGQPVRAALIAESVLRYAEIGATGRDEWREVRETIGSEVTCLGWLTRSECASGRGVTPNGSTGSIIVAALGDPVPPKNS
jgi:hypothetical protein